jgi:hypothetical protein
LAIEEWKEGEIYYRNPSKEKKCSDNMLQRVQTVFLLLAAAAMLIASVTPLALFLHNADRQCLRQWVSI